MICPYCSKEMTPGYIQSGRVVFFTEKERSMFFYQGPRKGDIQILKNMFSGEEASKKAFCCYICRKIVLEF